MTVCDPPLGAIRRLAFPFRLLQLIMVFSAFTVLTAIFFWPWLENLSSALIGPPEDNMQDFWNSWHAATARSWSDFSYTSQIRFPEGTPLAYHSFAWPQIAAVRLLTRLFGDDFATVVALHNLTVLASFPLAATTMFYLARHMLRHVPATHAVRDMGAVVAGFVFAFNPWHIAQAMHHAHVSGIEFLPLFVLFYLQALESRNSGKLAMAAVLQALSALSCWYFLFYTLYFMAFHLLYLRLRDKNWPRGWMLMAPLLCTGGALALLSPWLIPMVTTGLASPVYYPGTNMFVADLQALIAFPPTHMLAQWGSGVYSALTGNAWEGTVYLGLANLALLAWAMTRKGDKALLRYALGGMLFFIVIAGGEALHIGGTVTPLHLPGIILAKLPFFANVRTPARAMVFAYMFLGLGLAQATVMALRMRLPAVKAAAALGAGMMLLDFMPTHLSTTPATCSTALKVIAGDKSDFGVLDLPRGYGEGNAAMMQSACHGKPIMVGETSRRMGITLADRLRTADLAAQKRQLAAAGVKYIILHRPQGDLFRWTKADGVLADYPRAYRKVDGDNNITILSVY
ncbi:MAG TPA: hypothetical protein VJ750_09925 [Rhizomicrobium sp.]|nr:hypothetical protein [Rhizomicrobium sp.]